MKLFYLKGIVSSFGCASACISLAEAYPKGHAMPPWMRLIWSATKAKWHTPRSALGRLRLRNNQNSVVPNGSQPYISVAEACGLGWADLECNQSQRLRLRSSQSSVVPNGSQSCISVAEACGLGWADLECNQSQRLRLRNNQSSVVPNGSQPYISVAEACGLGWADLECNQSQRLRLRSSQSSVVPNGSQSCISVAEACGLGWADLECNQSQRLRLRNSHSSAVPNGSLPRISVADAFPKGHAISPWTSLIGSSFKAAMHTSRSALGRLWLQNSHRSIVSNKPWENKMQNNVPEFYGLGCLAVGLVKCLEIDL